MAHSEENLILAVCICVFVIFILTLTKTYILSKTNMGIQVQTTNQKESSKFEADILVSDRRVRPGALDL